MPEAGEVFSNLKRSTLTYDEELPTPDVEIKYDDRAESQQTIEAEQELFEENYRAAHARRWAGQERWIGRENEEMRLVNILHPHDFIRRLQAAGVDASIEPAVIKCWRNDAKTGLLTLQCYPKSSARLWLHEDATYRKGTADTSAGLIGISAWVKEQVKCLTSLQWDCGPEWSLMHFDQMGVPTRERYRGWRTALLRLITEDVITEDEALKAFGAPTENAASELYLETLKVHRERNLNRKGA